MFLIGRVALSFLSPGKRLPQAREKLGAAVTCISCDALNGGRVFWAANSIGMIFSLSWDIASGRLKRLQRVQLGGDLTVSSLQARSWLFGVGGAGATSSSSAGSVGSVGDFAVDGSDVVKNAFRNQLYLLVNCQSHRVKGRFFLSVEEIGRET